MMIFTHKMSGDFECNKKTQASLKANKIARTREVLTRKTNCSLFVIFSKLRRQIKEPKSPKFSFQKKNIALNKLILFHFNSFIFLGRGLSKYVTKPCERIFKTCFHPYFCDVIIFQNCLKTDKQKTKVC